MSIIEKPSQRHWPRVRALLDWMLDSQDVWRPSAWWWIITLASFAHIYWILSSK